MVNLSCQARLAERVAGLHAARAPPASIAFLLRFAEENGER
jgi:hypothetical protein